MFTQVKDRLIDRHELKRLVPYSSVHLLRLERAGKFPQRIRIGANRVGWSEREVYAWIEEHKIKSRGA